MIGPGWLPRPISRARRRTLAYTRPRRRRGKRAAAAATCVHDEEVLFDRGPADLPIATLVPHDPGARARALAFGLRGWLAARWGWLRPRLVPVVAAAVGTLMVIASAEYLARARDADPRARRGFV